MSPTTLISTRIEELIGQIDEVKVFEDHWKLVEKTLIQLRHELIEMSKIKRGIRKEEKISDTIEIIEQVAATCCDDQFVSKGFIYRELESLLLRLQFRLAQHHANLTDDYQTKVNILSDSSRARQVLMQKIFDKKMRQRLEHTKEDLGQLRARHGKTIESYLRSYTELHKSIPFICPKSEIVGKVANRFYELDPENQIKFAHKWQGCGELPLIRTFIQLRRDKFTSFERIESRRLLIGPEVNSFQDVDSERLVSAPYMLSMVERDRYVNNVDEENVSVENALRTKRWIVILGDPGSGKTSFSRWLVCHLAETLLVNRRHSTDFGPVRIPILIRIGEFAELLSTSSSLTLFDYVGRHTWMGKAIIDDRSISADKLSTILQDYIEQGQALIILDGLDEVPVSEQRSKVLNAVENFAETYVQTSTGESVFDNPHLSKHFDDPSESGRNQLIITSRIAGYHAAPLAGQFTYYTIRPMDIEHIKDFADYWFYRVHQQIIDILGLSKANRGRNHSESLKQEFEKENNTSLLDMASNPCLMSFICNVAFGQSNDASLPTNRIELYQNITDSMLSSWHRKGLTADLSTLIRILSDIAMYIHDNSASGLIHEDKMKEICIQSIEACIDKNQCSDEDLCEIENQAAECLRIFREDLGIFTARGESLYAFLHLTFQEYFTCLKLTNVDQLSLENKASFVTQSLRHHINDPRFHISTALALGKISSCWSPNDFDDLCHQFIQIEEEFDSLLPVGAFVLISSVNDLVHYPSNNILFDALDHLLVAAGEHRWSLTYPFLFDRIVVELKNLRHNIVPLWINNLLSQSPPHNIQTISALCALLEGKPGEFENIHWLDQSSCSILQSFSTLDDENNQFAIHQLLVKIAFFNHHLLTVHANSLKEFLIAPEIDLHLIPAFLFPLIITLYGGLKRENQSIVFDPYHIYRESPTITAILTRLLSRKDRQTNNQNLINIEQDILKALMARIETNDESWETVDLCIATICLYGIEFVQKNEKITSSVIFDMSLTRFKYVSRILRQIYFTNEEGDRFIENKTTTFISMLLKKIHMGQTSNQLFLSFLDSFKSGLARLRSSTTSNLLTGKSTPDTRVTLNLPNYFRKEYDFLLHLLPTDVQFNRTQNSCSLLHYFTRLFWILEHDDMFQTPYRMAVAMDDIPEYLLFRNDTDILFPLTFIPQHLQNLYFRLLEQNFLIINSKDEKTNDDEQLSFSHILIECLMVLSNTSCKSLSLLSALITLLPILRMHQLENFGGSLLWTLATIDSYLLHRFEISKEYPIDGETGLQMDRIENFASGNGMSDEKRRSLIDKCIKKEHERFRNALFENEERNTKLYSACISLARVSRWAQEEKKLHLFEESIRGAMSIEPKLMRLDALSVILIYSHSDYHPIQVNKSRSLQKEIEFLFNQIYPNLPVLLQTAIFIRCLPLIQRQDTIENCRKNLLQKLTKADLEDQQAAYEALSPYLQSNSSFAQFQKNILTELAIQNDVEFSRTMARRSSVLRECFTTGPYDNLLNESLSLSLLLSNMYLVELASELYECIEATDHLLQVSNAGPSPRDESIIIMKFFQLKSSILTVAQASTINDILSTNLSTNRYKYSKKFWIAVNDGLHRLKLVEFKACRLIHSWMKWKESTELSLFAFHAALLLAQSDFWSVEAASIVCDLLCDENDRFRQKAELIFRSNSRYNFRSSSTMGIDVLLTLTKKMAHFQHTSPFAKLTLSRMFDNITIDIQSHLETFLWLERYRIYALTSKQSSLNKINSSSISHFVSYFPSDTTMDVSFCGQIRNISGDLRQYICDLIQSNFSSFLNIEDDITSKWTLDSHVQFVVSVVVSLATLSADDDETRPLRVDTLTTILETSSHSVIRQAAAYALGYIVDTETYKKLFKKLQTMANRAVHETSNDSDNLISALISSYCYYLAVCEIDCDQDDIDLFRQLLTNSSQIILKAVHIGLARVLKDKSMLFEMLGSDPILCYHALIGSTAYFFGYNVEQRCAENVAEFIEEYPDLLSIFIFELYNSIRHFTKDVVYRETTDNILAYGYPQYVEVASFIAIRTPAAFISHIKDCGYEDDLKHSLFFTSKQHDLLRRNACITILSVFGELTVELCEVFVEVLSHNPHTQNTGNRFLKRISSIKDENAVRSLLFSYLKSKSMNIRYAAAKMLLHFSQSSLIPFEQVQLALSKLMLDPTSEEDLWLIEEPRDLLAECLYYYVGPLTTVIYSLLMQHLTGDTYQAVQRNELSDIELDFVQSEKASRLASCLYEEKNEDKLEIENFSIPSNILNDEKHSSAHHSSPTNDKSDNDEKPWNHEEQECNNDEQTVENDEEPVEIVTINNDMKDRAEVKAIRSPIIEVNMNPSNPPSRTSITAKNSSRLCVII
ncbi:unnamed protein product [Rotaria socialis]